MTIEPDLMSTFRYGRRLAASLIAKASTRAHRGSVEKVGR